MAQHQALLQAKVLPTEPPQLRNQATAELLALLPPPALTKAELDQLTRAAAGKLEPLLELLQAQLAAMELDQVLDQDQVPDMEH